MKFIIVFLERLAGILLLLAVLISGAGVGFLYWITTPSGTGEISRQISKQVARRVPGTRVVVKGVQFTKDFTVRLDAVRWDNETEGTILELNQVVIRIDPQQILKKRVRWQLRADVDSLNLSTLDQTIARGQWRARGFLEGTLRLEGEQRTLGPIALDLKSQGPGTLSAEIIARLAKMMPPQDAREELLAAIQGKPLFHFSVGKVRVTTGQNGYQITFFLNGDHLLEFVINVDKDLVGLLGTLWGGQSA